MAGGSFPERAVMISCRERIVHDGESGRKKTALDCCCSPVNAARDLTGTFCKE